MCKTLWIIDHYSSEPKYGGYTRQYNLAKGIAQSGINVVVIASSFSHFRHEYITKENIFTNEIEKKIHFVYLKTSSYENHVSAKRFLSMIDFVVQIRRYKRIIAQKFGVPDWVVASSPHIFDWIAGEHVAKEFNSKFNIEIRDFWPLELRRKNDSIVRKTLYCFFNYLETRAFRKADHIICTVPYGGTYCTDFNKPGKEKFVFIGHPLDCKNFDKLALKNWEALPKDLKDFIRDSFYCVFSGYYMKYEGVYEILQAARQLPHIKFVFVGSGEEESGMKNFVSKNNLANVFIGSRIEKECVPALLSHSNVCLAYLFQTDNPQMFKYGISKNKVNEYLYSGAVTIMGLSGMQNEIVDSGGGYTFEPTNNGFTSLIDTVYNMRPEERLRMGENARNYMLKEHNIDAIANKYVANILN